MRIVVDILLLLPALIYQNTLAANFQYRGVGLDLVAVVLATISIVQGWLYGALGGLVCGLIMDGVFGQPGYYALQYMLVGMLMGLGNERFRFDNWVLPAFAMLAVYMVKELIPAIYLFFAYAQVSWGYVFIKMIASSAVCALALLPIHWLNRMLHRWDVISAPIFNFHGRKW